MIPDIVREQVWEIVAKRFEAVGAEILSGTHYDDGGIAFEYCLPDGRRGRAELRNSDYEAALLGLADKVFPEVIATVPGASADRSA